MGKTTTDRRHSLEDVHSTVSVSYGRFFRRLFAFAGPAYIVSVGYMDPGNWATDLEGGSRFGYELLWVLLMSNLMALLLQTLAARMGIVSGRDLAQACRERYPKAVSFFLWILSEVAIAACDLAEVIGTVIGLNLLFRIPLQFGIIITVFDTFLLLAIQRLGMRKMEAFIVMLVTTIGLCFLLEVIWAHPVWGQLLRGYIPSLSPAAPFVFRNADALYIAIGIIGATVMPHNLYLHSALVQSRTIERSKKGLKEACLFNLIDSAVALNVAFLVNSAILVLAAAAFFRNGQVVNDIADAYTLLPQFLGTSAASALFAIALLCSGQSSTLTGTLAGQIIMEGFLHLRLQPWLRRLVTRSVAVLPAMLVIYILGGEHLKDLLILSQVVLSLQLPFAIIPLVIWTSDRRAMQEFANPLWVKVLAWGSAAVIIALNIMLVVSQLRSWTGLLTSSGHSPLWLMFTAVPFAIACGFLMLYLLLEPLLRSYRHRDAGVFDASHARALVESLDAPGYQRIGVAVENNKKDDRALRHAVAISRQHGADIVVLHVVDGVGGQWHGEHSADRESIGDRTYVDHVAAALHTAGLRATGVLRYGNPAEELIAAITDERLDFIVLRAHGHGFWKDRLFGQTIDKIRHSTSIPVLAVR